MKKTVPTEFKIKSSKLVEAFQKVDFSPPEGQDSYEIVGEDVVITPSSGNHESGSSKVKLHNIVDYTWEERFYTGQLLAVHKDGDYIAYGIKAVNKTVGVVRVVNRKLDYRALIKGMEGAVQDITFSYVPRKVILACMDLKGNLFVHNVVEDKLLHRLECELMLQILPDATYVSQPGDFFRAVWCPFIPEMPEGEEIVDVNDDVAWLLALTRGSKVELWNIRMILNHHGVGPVTPGDVGEGYLDITEHKKPIVAAAFSPDGTAVATASLDGEVMFFQVYIQNEEQPRCLHHWKPHGGEPLSSLFFLDNHKNYNPDVQYWKFAITGAKNNSELKVWSCESWSCLQTLAFETVADRPIKLSAGLDLAAGYLLLSDFHHKILYVFQLYTDNIESTAAIISVSEFLLPYPILSFGIVDAGLQRFKTYNLDEVCNDKNDEESIVGVLVKMYLVQPKSLQDCQIAFIPSKSDSFDKTELLSITESPFYIPPPPENDEELSSNKQELPANHSSLQQLNLMTPDAFNSPIKHETSASSLKKTLVEETSYSNSTTLVASPHSPDEADNKVIQAGVEISTVLAGYGFASGGSSPSREVQEILSEGKCYYQEPEEIQQDQDQVDITLPEEKPVSTVWPEIPMLKMTDVRKNEEHARKSVNQGESSAVSDADLWKLNQRLETSISSMINVMNSLMQASEEQANEIKQLREEMQQQHLLREIDQVITRNSQQQILLLENILAATDNNKQQEAAVTSAVIKSVSKYFLSTKFLEPIIDELPKLIVPTVVNQMESLKEQVTNEFTQKISATDFLLKENIAKMVNSEAVMKVLSTAVVSSLKPVISQCYKEYFTTVALPSFEDSCSTLFAQINETFLKGTKEYIATLDAQSSRQTEKNREQGAQLQALSEILNNNTTEMNKELKKSVTNIEKQIMESVTKALTVQQSVLEGSVIAAVQSRAVTPAPHVLDTQTLQKQILQLISEGDVNGAFQQALTASDLNLVVFICEKVNPQQLFSQDPCPLQQHVLLSLVQQLSADMNSHTQIKQKYLEEALMNLDINNKLTQEFLPVVLSELQRHLQAYIRSNPNNRITRSMRILLMASHSVLGNTAAPTRPPVPALKEGVFEKRW